jgi:hypothetical protein
MVGRSSNIKSYNILMKMGGEMLTKIKVKDGDRSYTLSFMKIKFQPN